MYALILFNKQKQNIKKYKRKPYKQHNPKIVLVILYCGEIFYFFIELRAKIPNNQLFLSDIVMVLESKTLYP